MTDKKERILEVALTLFAQEGYMATSTRKVARQAGVSEGLLFRHFTNKEGLLIAISKYGEEKSKALFRPIIFESNPTEIIRKAIHLVADIKKNEEVFKIWKLEYKTKWQTEQYGEHKMEPLRFALTDAFLKLGYKEPKQEANYLIIQLDGLVTRFYLQKSFDLETMINFIINKYNK